MKTARKGLAILLSLLMLLSVLPLAVFAETWKDGAALRAQETSAEETQTESEEPITYTGDLISSEIVVGNERSVYMPDEDGRMQLVSQETTRSGGPLRTPAKPTGNEAFADESIDPLDAYAAASWALNHTFFEATTLLDQNGVAAVVYGIDGPDQYVVDSDCDMICDVCGYCVDGCVDGKTACYTKDDIAGEAVNGEYFNSDGVLVARDAEETDTYTLVDENGQPILDGNGNEQTVTETQSFIKFETHIIDGDGQCDFCGKPVCMYEGGAAGGHDFSDGLCDGCGACVSAHTDVEPADGICDLCGWCTGACADANANGVCDVCGKTALTFCEHSDIVTNGCRPDLGDYMCCNICSQSVCHRTTQKMIMLREQMNLLAGILAKGDEDGRASYHDWLINTLVPELTAKTKDNNASKLSFASYIAMRQEFQNAIDMKKELLALYGRVLAVTKDDLTPDSLAESGLS